MGKTVNPVNFRQLFSAPSLISGLSPEDLRQLLDAYPYFSGGRIIELLIAKIKSDPDYTLLLRKNSIHITDRRHLHALLTGDVSENFRKAVAHNEEMINPEVNVENRNGLTEDLIILSDDKNAIIIEKSEDFVSTNREELLDFSDAAVSPAQVNPDQVEINEDSEKKLHVTEISDAEISASTGSFIESGKTDLKTKVINNKTELLDKFIANEPGSIRPGKENTLIGDVSTGSIQENEEFITDTLAKIYIKQGLYTKAIYAYEKLILKYPEKSVYFASQIEEIKKIINKK